MPAAQPHTGHRGDALLLAHCAALGSPRTHSARPYARLAALVGPALAHVLVHGLAAGPPRGHAA